MAQSLWELLVISKPDWLSPSWNELLNCSLKEDTNQTRRGVSLFVSCTHNCLCPVTAILAYLAVRGTLTGTTLLAKDGTTLTCQKLVKMVQSMLAGIDPSGYSGHSFCIGAATTAAAKGIDADTIRTLGRWSSDTYQRYIQIPRQELAIISQQIARP